MWNKEPREYNWKTIFTLLPIGILLFPFDMYLQTIGPGTLGSDGLEGLILAPVAIVSWLLMIIFVGIYLSSTENSKHKKIIALLSLPSLALFSLLMLFGVS